jgi:myosin-5
MLRDEQAEYQAEGISWDKVDFRDNLHVLSLLEGKPSGVFSMLDEECQLPKGSPESYLQKLTVQCAKQAAFSTPRMKTQGFVVAHYSGQVEYNVSMLLDKNRDVLYQDLIELIGTSENPFIRNLFVEDTKPKTSRSASTLSVSAQFKRQLDSLIESVGKTETHYIRCINPNSAKEPSNFVREHVLQQLKCAGVMETVKIRKAGFAIRRPFAAFIGTYRILACTNEDAIAPVLSAHRFAF